MLGCKICMVQWTIYKQAVGDRPAACAMRCARCQFAPEHFRCGQCASVGYCSRACAQTDWDDGGHALACGPKRGLDGKVKGATGKKGDPIDIGSDSDVGDAEWPGGGGGVAPPPRKANDAKGKSGALKDIGSEWDEDDAGVGAGSAAAAAAADRPAKRKKKDKKEVPRQPWPPKSECIDTLFPTNTPADPGGVGEPVEVGSPNWEVVAAGKLMHHGILVLRDPDLMAHRDQIKGKFNDAIAGMPEFNPEYAAKARLNESDIRFVRGGFAALNNASAYHNPFVRRLREAMMTIVIPVASKVVASAPDPPAWAFEQCIDRMLYRSTGDAPTAESWHMDLPDDPGALKSKNERFTFGGWYSVGRDQHFSCIPRSHLYSKDGVGHGFCKLQPGECQLAKDLAEPISVPEGCLVMFDESIVHEVLPGKPKKGVTEAIRRVFLGWALQRRLPGCPPLRTIVDQVDAELINEHNIPDFDSTAPTLKRRLDELMVIPHKSGQISMAYPTIQYANFLISNYPSMYDETKELYRPELIGDWPPINSTKYVWKLTPDGAPILTGKLPKAPTKTVPIEERYVSTRAAAGETLPFRARLATWARIVHVGKHLWKESPSVREVDHLLGKAAPTYPPYSDRDRELYYPRNRWELRGGGAFIVGDSDATALTRLALYGQWGDSRESSPGPQAYNEGAWAGFGAAAEVCAWAGGGLSDQRDQYDSDVVHALFDEQDNHEEHSQSEEDGGWTGMNYNVHDDDRDPIASQEYFRVGLSK